MATWAEIPTRSHRGRMMGIRMGALPEAEVMKKLMKVTTRMMAMTDMPLDMPIRGLETQ